MQKEKYNDIYAGALVLLIGLVLFAASFSIPKGAAMNIGSDFMPKVTSGLMAILGLLILKNGITMAKNYEEKPVQDVKHYKELAISIVLLTAYMVLLVPVGFLIMTTLYVGAQATVLAPKEKRAPVKFFAIGLIAAAAIYFIFRNVFVLMLPAGILSFLG